MKLAKVDISKQQQNNNSVIAPSLLVSPGLHHCYQSLCLLELPISPRACLHLISPSHFMERKFLKDWARQIATDLSLPSGADSFFKQTEPKWLIRLSPPTSSPLLLSSGRTHPLLSEDGCILLPLPRLCTCLPLMKQESCLWTQVARLLKPQPCWEFKLEEGGPRVNMSKAESWQKLNDSHKPAARCVLKRSSSNFTPFIDCLMSVGSQRRDNQGGASLEWKAVDAFFFSFHASTFLFPFLSKSITFSLKFQNWTMCASRYFKYLLSTP